MLISPSVGYVTRPKRGTILLLSGANWHVTGGGQRPVGLTFEWVKMGYDVIFVERWERVDEVAVPPPAGVTILKVSELKDIPSDVVLVYVSLPAPDYNQLVKEFRRRGLPVHYDIYDHWESMFKEQHHSWFQVEWEEELVSLATSFSCVSPTLKEAFREGYSLDVPVIPNAADPSYWKPVKEAKKEAVALYIGTLGKPWEWVSHEALVEVARAFPAWEFRIIGGYLKYTPPENVRQYGQVPHDELVRYAIGGRIGLVPFKKCYSAYYCDPIKAWEYLAAGMAVAVTNVPAWRGMPNTYFEEGDAVEGLLHAFERAASQPLSPLPYGFWSQHSWRARAEAILKVAGLR